MIQKLIAKFLAHKMATVMYGTAGSQFIIFLFMPYITRIYDPSDFGKYSSFMVLVSLFGALLSLRFESFIIYEPEIKNKQLAIGVAFGISIIIFLVFSLFFLVFGKYNLLIYSSTIFLFNLIQVLNNFLLFKENFIITANAKIIQAVFWVIAVSFMGTFYGYIVSDELIIFYTISLLFSFGFLWILSRKSLIFEFDGILLFLRSKLFNAIKISFSFFTNTIGLILPILFYTAIYASNFVGLYSLSQRIVQAPLGLIAASIGQVYYSSGTKIYHNGGRVSFRAYFLSRLKRLSMMSFFLLLPLQIGFSTLAPAIFGKTWTEVGSYILVMIPHSCLEFVVSPLSMTLNILGYFNLQLILDVLRSCLIVVVFLISFLYKFDIKTTIFMYSIVMSVIYAVYLGYYWKVVYERKN